MGFFGKKVSNAKELSKEELVTLLAEAQEKKKNAAKREKELKALLTSAMEKEGVDSVQSGRIVAAKQGTRTKLVLVDDNMKKDVQEAAFIEHLLESGEMDLLDIKPSIKSIMERSVKEPEETRLLLSKFGFTTTMGETIKIRLA